MKTKGNLIIFSAPSGAGKTTIVKEILASFPTMIFSISATTRKPRPGEKDGVDYFFLDKDKFEELIKNDELLEYEKIYDYYYGTLKKFILDNINNGLNILMDIDVKGALNVKKKYPQATIIFIAPPSIEELEKRLINRGSDTPEEIKKRISRAKEELEYMDKFDYVIINDDLNIAKEEAKKIIKNILEGKNESTSN